MSARVCSVCVVVLTMACARPGKFAPLEGRDLAEPPEGWSYEIVEADDLVIEAAFARGSDTELTVDSGGEPSVRDVEVRDGNSWRSVSPEEASWRVPACARGCRVRYRYTRDSIESLPSKWLLRPRHAEVGTPFRFHVTPAPGHVFVSGIFPVAGALDTYAGKSGPHFELPYSALGALRVHDIPPVQIAVLGALQHERDVVAWVAKSTRAIEAFYGRFPVQRLLLLIHSSANNEVDEGRTMGNAGAAIDIDVGEKSTRADLESDWVLIHEMIHTALPNLASEHRWLEEGLATYVEPLVRVRAGLKTKDAVWHDWIVGMPHGLPEAGDLGLDRTNTWGRAYWGGALFCLLVDVEIRARTHNAKSIDDGLRAILAAGGNIATTWTIDHVIEVADAAIGIGVFREIYDIHARAAVKVDLDALWKRLGVSWNGHEIAYDEDAPQANIRRAMTVAL